MPGQAELSLMKKLNIQTTVSHLARNFNIEANGRKFESKYQKSPNSKKFSEILPSSVVHSIIWVFGYVEVPNNDQSVIWSFKSTGGVQAEYTIGTKVTVQ